MTTTATRLQFACPACGHIHRAAPELAGRKGRCGRCRGAIRVPDSGSERTAHPTVVAPSASASPETLPAATETPDDPSYRDFLMDAFYNPFGSLATAGLSLTTLAAVWVLFEVFGRSIFADVPAGTYPTLLLAAPFLFGGLLVFLLLSPAFYALRPRLRA